MKDHPTHWFLYFTSMDYQIGKHHRFDLRLWDDFEDPNGTLADTRERVSKEGVQPRLGYGEFGDYATTWRNYDSLVADHMVSWIAIGVAIAENSPNDVES